MEINSGWQIKSLHHYLISLKYLQIYNGNTIVSVIVISPLEIVPATFRLLNKVSIHQGGSTSDR